MTHDRQKRGAFRKGAPDQHRGAEPPVVAAMRAAPGEWFIVEEGAPRPLLGFGLNYSWIKAHERDGFELDIRDGIPEDASIPAALPQLDRIVAKLAVVTVYARYVTTTPDTAAPAAERQRVDLRKVTNAHRPETNPAAPSC